MSIGSEGVIVKAIFIPLIYSNVVLALVQVTQMNRLDRTVSGNSYVSNQLVITVDVEIEVHWWFAAVFWEHSVRRLIKLNDDILTGGVLEVVISAKAGLSITLNGVFFERFIVYGNIDATYRLSEQAHGHEEDTVVCVHVVQLPFELWRPVRVFIAPRTMVTFFGPRITHLQKFNLLAILVCDLDSAEQRVGMICDDTIYGTANACCNDPIIVISFFDRFPHFFFTYITRIIS